MPDESLSGFVQVAPAQEPLPFFEVRAPPSVLGNFSTSKSTVRAREPSRQADAGLMQELDKISGQASVKSPRNDDI